MSPHPLSPNEAERLAVLRDYAILDTAPAKAFDALVDCARRLFDIPICLVSLVDEHRQWFKAGAGVGATETPRELAFCNHTILDEGVFVVEDAAADPRFRDNALVTGDLGLRFYAGAPLTVASGHALGSLCVIDRSPRVWTDEQRAMLENLATVAVALLESHRTARRSGEAAAEAEARSRDLAIRERQLQRTAQFARIGGWEIDVATMVITFSDEARSICGYPPGVAITFVDALTNSLHRAHLSMLMQRAAVEGIGFDDEFEICTPAGERVWIRSGCEVETVNGVPSRLYGVLQDITQRRAAERELWHAANHDALTRLPNRSQFARGIDALFARRAKGGPVPAAGCDVGLLMIDVDHLKEVNDTLGHAAGDALLRAVAERLSGAVGSEGSVARIGGDEFVVTLAGTVSSERLADLGRAITVSMQPRIQHDGQTLSPQVSIGGALAAEGDTADLLRQKADLALYACKRTRRGRYTEFRDDLRAAVLRRIGTVRSVDDALIEGRMLPHYQPVVRLGTGAIIAIEALARMRMPDERIVAAGAFHEALADPRIAYRLTGQMMAQVAADIRTWLDAGLGVPRVGINFTTADFQVGDIRDRLAEAFGRHRVPLTHIAIEVTEGVFMTGNEAAVVRDLEALRADGAYVALDDFGTGFASLTQLRTLPVNGLKIDKSFVDGMLVDETSGPIVEGLVDLARKLGLGIIAEGIETLAQAKHLRGLGCPYGQGFLFARPAGAERMGALLACSAPLSDVLRRPRPKSARRRA